MTGIKKQRRQQQQHTNKQTTTTTTKTQNNNNNTHTKRGYGRWGEDRGVVLKIRFQIRLMRVYIP